MLNIQADYLASAMWEAYCKATEPSRRAHYAARYVFWASVRDEHKAAGSAEEPHGKQTRNYFKGCACGVCNPHI